MVDELDNNSDDMDGVLRVNLDHAATVQTYKEEHWEDDPGERARRIYEWWRVLMNTLLGEVHNFAKACD